MFQKTLTAVGAVLLVSTGAVAQDQEPLRTGVDATLAPTTSSPRRLR
jgi:hypothetical protein